MRCSRVVGYATGPVTYAKGSRLIENRLGEELPDGAYQTLCKRIARWSIGAEAVLACDGDLAYLARKAAEASGGPVTIRVFSGSCTICTGDPHGHTCPRCHVGMRHTQNGKDFPCPDHQEDR